MAVTLSDVSSEVLLRILGYLDDARDLTRIRQTNRRLRSIARDSLLWKSLFQHTFLINSTANIDVVDGNIEESRKRRKLETSYNIQDEQQRPPTTAYTDWYSLYKISHNWRTGNYAAHNLEGRKNAEKETLAKQTTLSRDYPATLVATTDDFVFTASRDPTTCSRDGHLLAFLADTYESGDILTSVARLSLPTVNHDQILSVTAIAVELHSSDPSSILITMACTDGTLRFIAFDKKLRSFRQEAYKSVATSGEISLLSMCESLLATCTMDFNMTLYHYHPESATIRTIGTRRGHGCQWPANMRMTRKCGSPSAQLSIAYVKNMYPSGWTVALQQFDVGQDRFHAVRCASAPRFFPTTAEEQRKRTKDTERAQTSNGRADLTVNRLTSLCYEDGFIVVGSRDNSVFCFKVEHGNDRRPIQMASTLGIRHFSTLHDHTGSVHSVSLNDGRCVTGGADGSVRVWRLSDESAYLSRTIGLKARLRTRFRGTLANVVTLRIPDEQRQSKKRKRVDTVDHRHTPVTLSDILRDVGTSTAGSPNSVIKWVASAFDRIISVSQAPSSEASTCRAELLLNGPQQPVAEHVQIWSFS